MTNKLNSTGHTFPASHRLLLHNYGDASQIAWYDYSELRLQLGCLTTLYCRNACLQLLQGMCTVNGFSLICISLWISWNCEKNYGRFYTSVKISKPSNSSVVISIYIDITLVLGSMINFIVMLGIKLPVLSVVMSPVFFAYMLSLGNPSSYSNDNVCLYICRCNYCDTSLSALFIQLMFRTGLAFNCLACLFTASDSAGRCHFLVDTSTAIVRSSTYSYIYNNSFCVSSHIHHSWLHT